MLVGRIIMSSLTHYSDCFDELPIKYEVERWKRGLRNLAATEALKKKDKIVKEVSEMSEESVHQSECRHTVKPAKVIPKINPYRGGGKYVAWGTRSKKVNKKIKTKVEDETVTSGDQILLSEIRNSYKKHQQQHHQNVPNWVFGNFNPTAFSEMLDSDVNSEHQVIVSTESTYSEELQTDFIPRVTEGLHESTNRLTDVTSETQLSREGNRNVPNLIPTVDINNTSNQRGTSVVGSDLIERPRESTHQLTDVASGAQHSQQGNRNVPNLIPTFDINNTSNKQEIFITESDLTERPHESTNQLTDVASETQHSQQGNRNVPNLIPTFDINNTSNQRGASVVESVGMSYPESVGMSYPESDLTVGMRTEIHFEDEIDNNRFSDVSERTKTLVPWTTTDSGRRFSGATTKSISESDVSERRKSSDTLIDQLSDVLIAENNNSISPRLVEPSKPTRVVSSS